MRTYLQHTTGDVRSSWLLAMLPVITPGESRDVCGNDIHLEEQLPASNSDASISKPQPPLTANQNEQLLTQMKQAAQASQAAQSQQSVIGDGYDTVDQ